MKVPKKYECRSCGFISNNIKKSKVAYIGFATCFKCNGSVKETDEWQKWYNAEQDKLFSK